jgi:hypothetical protein
MCSYANRETVAKALGIYNAGNEQQTELKYICVKFFVDDDELVPFPEFFWGYTKLSLRRLVEISWSTAMQALDLYDRLQHYRVVCR